MDNNTFSPMERMVELGLGVGLAQQMMRTMNDVMNSTCMPQASTAAPAMPQAPKSTEYYVVINESVSGPYNEDLMAQLIASHMLTTDSWVWTAGMQTWLKAAEVPQVNKMFVLAGLNGGC